MKNRSIKQDKDLYKMFCRINYKIENLLLPNKESPKIEVNNKMSGYATYSPRKDGEKGVILINENRVTSQDQAKILAHEIVHSIEDCHQGNSCLDEHVRQANDGLAVFVVDKLFGRLNVFKKGYSNTPSINHEGFSKVGRIFNELGKKGLVYVLKHPFLNTENIDSYIQKAKLEVN